MSKMVVALIAMSVLGVSLAHSEEGSRERPSYTDNPTPSVSFVSPKNGAILKAGSVNFEVETANYKFDYGAATSPGDTERLPINYASQVQEPNSGHDHVVSVQLGPCIFLVANLLM